MNKLINDPSDMIREMQEGYIAVYGNEYEAIPNVNGNIFGIVRKCRKQKVSIVIGGGSGNEPWVMGHVGLGLADGAALGQIFSAPPARAILNVTKSVPNKEGVVYICTNHAGDVLNFELVGELAGLEGIRTQCVMVSDDIASAPYEEKENRRGIAGIALVVKIAGAAAESGCSFDEVVRIARKTDECLHTYSVTTSAGYMPDTGKPMYELPDGMMAYGMGFNGETETANLPFGKADEIVDKMMDALLSDVHMKGSDEIVVMLNGFGFTSIMELCIIARRISEILSKRQVVVHDFLIDELFCPQGTGGFSISILKMDDELSHYFDVPAYSPFYKRISMELVEKMMGGTVHE